MGRERLGTQDGQYHVGDYVNLRILRKNSIIPLITRSALWGFPSCISLTFNLIPFYHCPRVPLSIKEDTDPVTWLCPFPALLAYCRRPSSFQRKDEPWQAWCCGMGWGDGRSLDYKDTERRACVPGVSQTPHLAQGKALRANAMDTSTMLWRPG